MPPSTSTGAGVAGRVEQRANRADLVDAARDERLSAEARVDRHDEDEVDVAGDVLDATRPASTD